jgi:hypothetical protein
MMMMVKIETIDDGYVLEFGWIDENDDDLF